MVESAILDVCNFLKAKNILIPSQNQWLRGSIGCFREINRNCTPNQLKEFVFSQWKLADLKDISAPTLPNNCKTALKLTLPGKYAVQINYAINIGESFYKQLQKIRRPASEDNLSVDSEKEKGSNEVQANRTLKLEITDGVVTLLGFEDKLIRKLVEPFVPGVKAILSGPIECRKGVLFLKSENIDILGGEVDTLHIPNATENLLARALKQPENPDPYNTLDSNQNGNHNQQQTLLDIPEDDAEAFLQIPDDIEYTQTTVINSDTYTNSNRSTFSQNTTRPLTNSSSTPTYRNANTFSQSVQSSHSFIPSRTVLNNEVTFRSTAVTGNNQTTNDQNQSLDSSSLELEDDEEFALMAAETASLAEQTVKTNKTPPNTKQSTLSNFFQNKNTYSDRNAPSNSSNFTRKGNKSPENKNKNYSKISKPVTNKPKITKSSDSDLRAQLEESYSSFMESDSKSKDDTYTSIFQKDSSSKVTHETQNATLQSNVNKSSDSVKISVGSNVVLSKQEKQSKSEVLMFPPKKYPCTQTVRGSVENISQKLSITENKWNLSAIVKMKGVEMEVDFSPEALDKVFGMTASELQAKRKEVKKNPQLKEKINEILRSSQRRIQQLNCDMKVHFTSYIGKPIILDILD